MFHLECKFRIDAVQNSVASKAFQLWRKRQWGCIINSNGVCWLHASASWWAQHGCWTVCPTNPSNDQLVKDEWAQIFYCIWLQTKPIAIGVNCEIPHNPSLTMRLQRLEPMTLALIPLVGPCALPIHPTTNWWRMRGHKSFIAFDRRPSPLLFEQIVKSLTIPPSQCGSNDSNLWPGSDTTCWTVCLTDPSNNQLVKDEWAQIFYSIRLQTKPIAIGANCEIPHNGNSDDESD